MTWLRQVSYLVAPQASRWRQLIGEQFHLGGALIGLLSGHPFAPRACATAHRQVVSLGPGQTLDIGVIEGERVGREMLRLQGQGRLEGGAP